MANWAAGIYNTLKEAETAIGAIADSKEIHATAFKEGALQKVLIAQGSPYPSVTDIWDKDISAYTGAKAGTYLKTLYDDWLNGGRLDLILDLIAADTIYIADGALPADPTANSLARFIASGGTALGRSLPASTSLVDLLGNYTGPYNGAAQDDNVKASLDLAHTDLDNILLDTQLKFAVSGSKTFTTGLEKFLNIDSGTDGAEIVSITVKGVVGADWTVEVYIPTDDAVAAPAAGDKRAEEAYVNTDTEAGQLSGIGAIRYNMFLDITNDSAGSDNIDEVIIAYRSRGTVTATWEA